jgi:putative membrane protein
MDPLLLNAIVFIVVSAIVLIVVDRLNLGLSVGGFLGAIIAAVAIFAVAWLVDWLLTQLGIDLGTGNDIMDAIIRFVVAAAVLMLAAAVVPRFETHGFTGALIAAIAIAVIYFLINLVIPSAPDAPV